MHITHTAFLQRYREWYVTTLLSVFVRVCVGCVESRYFCCWVSCKLIFLFARRVQLTVVHGFGWPGYLAVSGGSRVFSFRWLELGWVNSGKSTIYLWEFGKIATFNSIVVVWYSIAVSTTVHSDHFLNPTLDSVTGTGQGNRLCHTVGQRLAGKVQGNAGASYVWWTIAVLEAAYKRVPSIVGSCLSCILHIGHFSRYWVWFLFSCTHHNWCQLSTVYG